jgi:ABC-type Zn uptake system ZnuABC Zn-binding protein ZnuA
MQRQFKNFAAALMSLAITAGHSSAQDGSKSKLHVVTTLGVLADLAKQIGGDRVEVQALADARQDPHYVEPRPTLMQRARDADLFIEIGLQLEMWADKVVSGSGNTKIQTGQPGRVVASAGISTLELPTTLSREWGDVHPYGNPHVWLDPLNAKDMASNICDGLSRVDSGHAGDYKARLESFQEKIDESMFGPELVKQVGGKKLGRLAREDRLNDYLQSKDLAKLLGGWLKKAEVLRGRPIVTYHKTSIYLAQRFGFTIPLEIEEKPGIPPSARHRDHVVETIQQQGIRTVLQEPYYDREAADYLAAKTGVHVVIASNDVGEEVGVADYFALIDGMLTKLVESESRKN